MKYVSTRDSGVSVTASQAIVQGISNEGGLFVPESIPVLSKSQIAGMTGMDYINRAKAILSLYLDDFTEQELEACVRGAYGSSFSDPAIAPLSRLGMGNYLLELWHGPTCAFKDMALQLLPHLLTVSMSKAAPDKEVVILVATSGDTGKAALEGFKDVPGTRILVFYPVDGVSPMQKRQMTTQEGGNVGVVAIAGNFDDAQTGVKKIFTDEAVQKRLAERGMLLSSANSINWGRLVPQIVYYFSAYAQMLEAEEIRMRELVNIVVPTGNFGNILAAYFACEMGLPVKRFLCASNQNNVLTDFINTGIYDRNRAFHNTITPSMDILISSNLERLLYLLSDRDSREVGRLMEGLSKEGRYAVSDTVKEKMQARFSGGCLDDGATKGVIREVFEAYGYLCDPHTAVAVGVHRDYVRKTGDGTKAIIASTASPYKFAGSVLSALTGENGSGDEFLMASELSRLTGVQIPGQLAGLSHKPERFTRVCAPGMMEKAVMEELMI